MIFHTDRNTLENFDGHKTIKPLKSMRGDHPGIANAILLKSLHHGYLRRGPVELSLPHRQTSISNSNSDQYFEVFRPGQWNLCTSIYYIYNRWGSTRWGGVRPLPGSSRLLSSRCRWPLLTTFCLLPCPLLFPFSDPDCSMTSISSLPTNISKLQFAVLAITK